MIARRILVVSRTPALARDVQAAAGPGYIVTHHDRTSDVEEFAELKGPFDLVVAGALFDSRSGMDRLRRLRQSNPGVPLVLALAGTPRTPLPDLIRVGAVDLIELPADRRQLAAALRRALSNAVASGPAGEGTAEEEPTLAEVISVASPSGGCGKTFYSTNLAWYLASQTGRRVCLVDLDLQFGEVVSALRLKPRWTMVDAVARSDEEGGNLDGFIDDYLVTHESGFWILPAPRHPAEADRITLADITRMVEALRRRFDYVVIDTSAQLSEVTLAALEHSTALICMATVDVPSIRNMRVFLDTMNRLNIPADRVAVILNKVESDIGIQVEEVDEALDHKVISVLPYAREVSRSINQGRPVMLAEPKSEITRRLADGMRVRIGATGPDDGNGSGGAGRRWARRGADGDSTGAPGGSGRGGRRIFRGRNRKEEGR